MKKIFILLFTLASLSSMGQTNQSYVYRDNDGDGFGDPNFPIVYNPFLLGDGKVDGFTIDNTDCDDYNANVRPDIIWYKDADGDKCYDGTTTIACYQPAGYIHNPRTYIAFERNIKIVDCFDFDPNLNEIIWYTDNDGDGYKQPDVDPRASYNINIYSPPIRSCTRPVQGSINFTTNFGIKGIDCDDTDPNIYLDMMYTDEDGDGFPSGAAPNPWCVSPSNPQTPPNYFASQLKSLSIDCDDHDANNVPTTVWYKDNDGDGFTSGETIVSCVAPIGYIRTPKFPPGEFTLDCNDNDAQAFPFQNWTQDNDGDGYGKGVLVGGYVIFKCQRPAGNYFTTSELLGDDDCNDNIASINPKTEWCIDADIDRYYAGDKIVSCTSPGPGYVVVNKQLPGDCNDNDVAINPATIWLLDADGDGYHEKLYFAMPGGSCTPPQDGRHYINNSKGADCDDNDATSNPETVWVMDADGDGYYTGEPYKGCILFGGSGYVRKTNQQPGDCNDNDNTKNIASFWLLDADKDGYHQKDYYVQFPSCAPPDDGRNYINNSKGQDCNDSDPTYTPETVWVMDADGDGYYTGEPYTGCFFIFTPGYVRKTNQQSGDCDDNNKAINPATNWFRDADGDGYSDGQTSVGCTRPLNFKLSTELAFSSIDCRDDIKAINPGATEICDGIDNDCDGLTDEGVTTTFYLDKDGDGFGNASVQTQACSAPSGYVADSRDCDDNNKAVNPNTVWIVDADADGYYTGTTLVRCISPGAGYIIRSTQLPGDCLDNNASVNSGAVEVCGNKIDDNCNGSVDEATCFSCQNGTNLNISGITNNSAQLSWSALANPVQWQVQYKTIKQGSKWVDVLVTGNKRLVVLTGLLNNQNYQWQIRAKCGNSWTSYSNIASFITGTTNLLSREAVTEITDETVAKPGVRVYPNPSQGQFKLEMQLPEKENSIVNIQVIDLTGRILQTEIASITNGYLKKSISLHINFTNGMYLLRIIAGNKTYTTRLVYEK